MSRRVFVKKLIFLDLVLSRILGFCCEFSLWNNRMQTLIDELGRRHSVLRGRPKATITNTPS